MSVSKEYDNEFFKQWTTSMAYVLGFLYADGNIVKTAQGNHYVALYSSDRELLVSLQKSFQSEHKLAERNARSGRVFRVQIGSREWFSDLQKIGLTPNKAKRMAFPNIPQHYFGDFIRGYFDGDGNVWVGEVHKNRKTSLKTIQVAFTSGSQGFIQSLHRALKEKGVSGGYVYIPKDKHFARLTLSVKDALKLYEIMYNSGHKLHLERKKKVFEQFIQMRA